MPENTETPEVDTTEDVQQTDTPTDNVTVTESTDEDQISDPTPEVDAEDQGDDGPGREAKKYRLRLREAEGRVAELESRVEAMQRAEVDRIATTQGIKPAALWAAGTNLPDLLTETGTVDTDAVDAAIKAASESLGLPDRRKNIVPQEGRNPRPPRNPSGIAGMVQTVMGRTE